MFLDLDRFKVINDSLGHMIGDQLLVAVSRTLEACVRPTDLVARLGGDEFTILLDGIRGEDDAIRVADRIQSAIVRPFNLSGQEVVTTVSIGIALSTTGYDGVEELMRDADTAMYRAKTLGRARYETFDKELHIQAMARMRIETELRRAIDAQELMLLYQPIIKVETGRICGFEALVRWPHPERGLVSPVEFIPIAEETGMIVPLGAWVLRTACFQLKAWRRRHPTMPALSVAVNLSPKQFQAPDLVEQVRDCIHDSGISPQHLKLEITEGVFLENAEQATDVINGLKGLGVELYIDDFGTGYSSLSYLQRLPIDKVKIDRSFVGRMEEGDEARTLVHTVIELAHNLGMTTVAEGVETARHVAILQDLGCEYAQGYFFARPLNARAASSLLARNPVYKRPQTAPPEPDQIQSRPAGPPPPPVPIRAHLAAK